MKFGIRTFLMLLTLSIGPVLASSARAADSCPDFPKSKWWNDTTNKRISAYVARKHQSDWAPYIKKWDGQLSSMKKIYARDGEAVFKSRNATLSGEVLKKYIEDLIVRLEVIECLAQNSKKATLMATAPDETADTNKAKTAGQ